MFNSTTGDRVATLENPVPAAANFGYSVAVSGTMVVVGTPSAAAYIFDATTGNLLRILNDPSPQGFDGFGSSVAVSGSTVVVGSPYNPNDNGGTQWSGSAYIFDATTGNLLWTLNDPRLVAGDVFGWSVAVSGTSVVVGASGDSALAAAAGAAYVFDAATGNLLQTLADPTPAYHDLFGTSVAVSGSTVVIGSPSIDPTSDQQPTLPGSAYVFDAATGNLLSTLAKPSPTKGDQFGYSVGISGSTVVVGACYDDTGATDAGSAYVFDAPSGNLLHTLNNPTPHKTDEFGYSVAVSETTVVAGTRFVGSADIFDAATGNLLSTLANPTPQSADGFGYSVAASGNTLVVGAPSDRYGTTRSGSAYVYNAVTGNLLSTLRDPTPRSGDQFGSSVAVSGNTVVVGAPFKSWGFAYCTGTVYIYDAATGNLRWTINDPTPQNYDLFGSCVAVSGNTVVVGTGSRWLKSGSATSAVYVFDAVTGRLLRTINDPMPLAWGWFGCSVAVSGNAVVVGDPQNSMGADYAGLAYIFDAATGTLLSTLQEPAPAVNDYFGYSVAASGNTVVVGTPHYYLTAGSGSAYVFDAATGSLRRSLINPAPQSDDEFGVAVAVTGNTVVVGAPGELPGEGTSLPGLAYFFDATTGNLLATLADPVPAPGGGFGSSVAVSDSGAVVGTPNAGICVDRGAAYVFGSRPNVLSVTPNLTMVSGNSLGAAKFQVRITYDTDMKLGSTPMFTFTPNLSGTLTQSAGWWIDCRTYYAQYDVKASSVNFPSISLVVFGGQDAAGDAQAAYVGPAGFTIDTADPAPTPASVLSVQPSLTLVSGRNVGQDTFAVRLTYSESMRWYGSIPTIGFSDPAANAVLQLDKSQSWWTGDTTYKAVYTVLPGTSVDLANLGITVSGALDPMGNPQAPYTGPTTGPGSFSIDTLDPPPPLANVKSIQTNLEQVTAADTMEHAGPDSFVVWVQYDQPMGWYMSIPTLTFVPDPNWYPVAGTLQLDLANSWWTGPDTYRAKFTVQNYYTIVNPSVGIAVTGAKDAIGNLQADYSGTTDVFEVNTAATAPLASVTGVTPSVATVTKATVGQPILHQTTGLVEQITFSESMASALPTVTLTANDPTQQAALDATLSYDLAWSWWLDYPTDTIFRAGFDVADSGVLGSIQGISIHVKWARDGTTYPYYDQVRYSGPANFNLDTVTPVSLSPLAASPSASSLTDAVLSSGALNLSVGTLHDRRECLSSATSADNQQSAINPIDKALVLTGTWLDNRL